MVVFRTEGTKKAAGRMSSRSPVPSRKIAFREKDTGFAGRAIPFLQSNVS
jgi:hypothetical protein